MDLEINGKKYSFKDKLTMMDYITSYGPKIQMGLRAQVKLLARMSQEPLKLTAKELLLTDASIVLKMIKEVGAQYGMAADYDFLENE